MPNYAYRCRECKHYFERFLHMGDRKQPEMEPCSECKRNEVQQTFETPLEMVDSVRIGLRRPDDGFREVLHKIHERSPGSTIKDTARYY